jgi:hypothetical protein
VLRDFAQRERSVRFTLIEVRGNRVLKTCTGDLFWSHSCTTDVLLNFLPMRLWRTALQESDEVSVPFGV